MRRPGGRGGAEGRPPCLSARSVSSRRLGACRGTSLPQAASLPGAPRPPTAVVGTAPSSAARAPREQPPGLGVGCGAARFPHASVRLGPGSEERRPGPSSSPLAPHAPCLFGPSPIQANPVRQLGVVTENHLHFRVQNIVGVALPEDSRKVFFSAGPEVLSGECTSSEEEVDV